MSDKKYYLLMCLVWLVLWRLPGSTWFSIFSLIAGMVCLCLSIVSWREK